MGFLKDLFSTMKGTGTEGSAAGNSDTTAQSNLSTADNVSYLTSVLREIGCRVKKEPDCGENAYSFTYQGEHLLLYMSNETPLIVIFDTHWYDVPLDDLDNLSLVREAVNECNKGDMGSVFYDIYKDDNQIVVGSKVRTHFGSYMPDSVNFMRYLLDTLLRKHHLFFHEIDEIRNNRYKKQVENG